MKIRVEVRAVVVDGERTMRVATEPTQINLPVDDIVTPYDLSDPIHMIVDEINALLVGKRAWERDPLERDKQAPPERIWLQWHDFDDVGDGVTWCRDQIHPSDAEYVLLDPGSPNAEEELFGDDEE